MRLKESLSPLSELTSSSFKPVIGDVTELDAKKVKRVVVCAGQVYYDLFNARKEAGNDELAIVRLEQLYPFPTEQLTPLLRQAQHILVVENNATGQLAGLIRMQTSGGAELKSILKYDGRLFTPGEIYRQCKEMI